MASEFFPVDHGVNKVAKGVFHPSNIEYEALLAHFSWIIHLLFQFEPEYSVWFVRRKPMKRTSQQKI